MERFEFQLLMFQEGIDALVSKINHLNDMLLKVKLALTTLWSAAMGWSLTTQSPGISVIGFCILVGFIYPDMLIVSSQDAYIDKLSQIYFYLNDIEKLENSFEDKKLPLGLIYPLSSKAIIEYMKSSHPPQARGVYSSFLRRPFLSIPYAFLFVCNLVLLVYLWLS
jgi:hypothetical protein